MIKKLTITDILLLISALLTLIYSELSWFKGERESALFVGLWVPSILGFAIFLRLVNGPKND